MVSHCRPFISSLQHCTPSSMVNDTAAQSGNRSQTKHDAQTAWHFLNEQARLHSHAFRLLPLKLIGTGLQAASGCQIGNIIHMQKALMLHIKCSQPHAHSALFYKAGPHHNSILLSGLSERVCVKSAMMTRPPATGRRPRCAPYPWRRFAARLLAGALVAKVARVGAALRPLGALLRLVLVLVLKCGPAQAVPAPVIGMPGRNRGACCWRTGLS